MTREHFVIRITDPWNDIIVYIDKLFHTYEDAKQYMMTQYDDLEQMDNWSWNDSHDLYEIIRCKEATT